MGLKLTFLRPDHLSPSFTGTMNKFSLVTCEGVKAAVISLSSLHVVLTKSIQIFSIFTGFARARSAVNPELSSSTIKSPDDHYSE